MSGIYGGMLYHFPELYRPITYFDQEALIDSGYDNRTDETPAVAVEQTALGEVKDSHGNIIKSDHRRLWINTQIQTGWFVRFNDVVYRVNRDNDWPFEGGFWYYELERLPGDNGDTTDAPAFNFGGDNLG